MEYKFNLPKNVLYILNTLKQNGYEGFIVGGSVRDYLLGVEPSDFDITTNAKPEEVKKIFKRTFDTGIEHGTVTVLLYENDKKCTYEITTYRLDGEYEDNRHPKNVEFVDNIIKDLSRRDFTINAIAYNDDVGIMDPYSGVNDISKKIIRAVGDPTKRFSEDALRMLRAIRFAAKLNFTIDFQTENSCKMLSSNIKYVSKERIQQEITKILVSPNPDFITKVFKFGLSKYISENLDGIVVKDLLVTKKEYLAYASFLYYNEKIAKTLMKELKLDNKTISNTLLLLKAKKYVNDLKYSSNRIDINLKHTKCSPFQLVIKKIINELGYQLTKDFIILINRKEDMDVSLFENYVEEYEKFNVPIFIKDIKINGEDLKNIGFKNEEIGLALNSLQKIIHERPLLNEYEILYKLSQKVYKYLNKKENIHG